MTFDSRLWSASRFNAEGILQKQRHEKREGCLAHHIEEGHGEYLIRAAVGRKLVLAALNHFHFEI